jgi:tRNA isopentenyl-2-thiomethyl-A-37 hydroxylase MiaE
MSENKATSSGKRAEDQTTLTFSLSKELKKFIEGLAASEERTVSNYLRLEMQRLKDRATQSPKSTSNGAARKKKS